MRSAFEIQRKLVRRLLWKMSAACRTFGPANTHGPGNSSAPCVQAGTDTLVSSPPIRDLTTHEDKPRVASLKRFASD